MGAEDLIANGKDVAVIDYHTGDAYDNNYGLSRLSYYGLQGTPTAWFDGGSQVVGGNHTQSMYGNYLPKYNYRKNIQSSFTIGIEGSNSGQIDYELDITVEKVAANSSSNLVMHVAVTESDIQQSWQGQSELNHVERLMAPNQYGTPLDFSGGAILEKTVNFTMNPDWVTENCEVVVFIQDTQTKEVMQGAKKPLSDFVTTNLYDAAVLELIVPNTLCNNSMVPKVLISNYGLENLTSLTLHIFVNDLEASTLPWTGNLGFSESEMVTFPEISNYTIEPSNVISVEADSPNGQTDQFPANNLISLNVDQALNVTSPVSLALKLDNNPEETSWELADSQGNILYSGGNYTTPNQFVVEQFDLEDMDCYSFIIYDEGGDGLTGTGQYKLAYNGTNIFAEGYGFGFEDQVQFGIGLTGTDEHSESAVFTIYPNPVDDVAYINFTMDRPAKVTLNIYNSTGDNIYHSATSNYNAGNYTLTMNGKAWSKGIYFVNLQIGEKTYSQKMIIR